MSLEFLKSELNNFKRKHPFLSKLSEQHLFAIACSSYFFFEGELKQSDFEEIFTDGKDDGEFDLVFNDDQSDANDLMLVQSKMSENLCKDDIIAILEKMSRTYDNLSNGHYEQYNDKVKFAFINSTDRKNELANNHLIIFTIYNPRDKIKSEIEKAISNVPGLKKYKIDIFYLDDIVSQFSSINEPKDFIEDGKILFFKDQGKIIIDEGNGAVVNVSAFDLKRLYSAYANKGLFNRNLRFYIKQKKVDEGINNTLHSNQSQFWYMNNGIIIGCEDFEIDGNVIKLSNFSIINGAQTTTLIGESQYVEKNSDFSIVCKIIKYTDEKFINDVAEASNSQKPINERDLIANRYEQKQLKSQLLNHKPPIHMEIKRGEKKPSKAKYPEIWQRVKNEDIGQLVLSIILQRPGTARSNKKTMFSVESTYDAVFRRHVDVDTIVDMLKLKCIYEQYIEKQISTFGITQKGVANNGKFCILSLIGFFIKLHKELFIQSELTDIINADTKRIKECIGKDNLCGKLISDIDNYEELIEELIYELIDELSDKYETEFEQGRTTSYSNFFKTDATYQTIILPAVFKKYMNKQKFKKEITECLTAFNK